MFEHGDVYCEDCGARIPIQWEAGNPNWMARAMAIGKQAHADHNPLCPSTTLKIIRITLQD